MKLMHGKGNKPQIVRENLVESMRDIVQKDIKTESDFLKAPNLQFGSYDFHSNHKFGWRPEPGQDEEGLTAEAFRLFFEEVRKGYVIHGKVTFSLHNDVLCPLQDEQLPATESEQTDITDFYRDIGYVMLWAIMQRVPVPSCLATPLWVSELLGFDSVKEWAPAEVIIGMMRQGFPVSWSNVILQETSIGKMLSEIVPDLRDDLDSSSMDEVISSENQVALWRSAVKLLLIEKRKRALRALREGFLGGNIAEAGTHPVLQKLWHMSLSERQMIICLDEDITAEKFCALLEPETGKNKSAAALVAIHISSCYQNHKFRTAYLVLSGSRFPP